MAQLETGIYNVRPRSVADYTAEADAADARKMAGESNRLQMLLQQRQVRSAERADDESNRFRSLLQGIPSTATDEDRVRLFRGAGFHAQADAAEKVGLDRRKAQADINKTTADTEKLQFEKARNETSQALNILGGVRDQASYQQAMTALQAMGVDATKYGATAQYDPAFIDNARQLVQTQAERLEQGWKAKGYGLDVAKAGETARHNRTAEGLTARGQNMTDARGREFNSIQKELLIQEKGLKIDKMQEEANQRAQAKDAAAAAVTNQIAVIDKALKHPGRKEATGLSSALDPRNFIPGTDATDFRVVLDQIGGAAFLQAFQSLKGGGAITETEGKKAQDAIARLNRSQSDSEFESALNDLREVMTEGYRRMTGNAHPGGAAQKQTGEVTDPQGRQPLSSFGGG